MYHHMSFRPEVNFTTTVAKAHITEFRQIEWVHCFCFPSLLFCYYILLKSYSTCSIHLEGYQVARWQGAFSETEELNRGRGEPDLLPKYREVIRGRKTPAGRSVVVSTQHYAN
jgi:hypothetical protein